MPDPLPTTSPPATPDIGTGRPSHERMSLRGPAIIVVAVATFIVVLGSVASALDTGGNPVLTLHAITLSDGTAVTLEPATVALRPVSSAGEPPADILASLAVPSGSVRRATVNTDQGRTQFDRAATFTCGLSSYQLTNFFSTLLTRLGWGKPFTSLGSAAGLSGTEVLGRKGSSDGYYWEVGAVVSPTTASGVTPFAVVVFEVPDSN